MLNGNTIQISCLPESHLITDYILNQLSIKSVCLVSVLTHVRGTHSLISLSEPQSTSRSVAAACFRKIRHENVRNTIRVYQTVNAIHNTASFLKFTSPAFPKSRSLFC